MDCDIISFVPRPVSTGLATETYSKTFRDPVRGESWKTITDWWEEKPAEFPADFDDRLNLWVSQRCVRLSDGETFYPVHFLSPIRDYRA